jgi:hypothetical protein
LRRDPGGVSGSKQFIILSLLTREDGYNLLMLLLHGGPVVDGVWDA